MGEYAMRLYDHADIKIGTCESMYYLRLEDVHKVQLKSGSAFGHFWRLPFPDEDKILPGEYEDYDRGLRLWKNKKQETVYSPSPYPENFSDPETIEHPGSLQLKHDCGLLLSVPCYHGEKLPKNINAHWNGKSWFYELSCLRTDGNKVYPVVKCRHCRKMWRYAWEDVLPYVQDKELKKRLEKYAE